MKISAISLVLVVAFAAMVCAHVSARAEDAVAFPEVKEGKVLQDNWYGVFIEGEKASFMHLTTSETEIGGTPCVMMQVVDTYERKSDGKAVKGTQIQRIVVRKVDFTPMFYSMQLDTPAAKLSVTAKVEKVDGGWTLTATNTVNGKTETKSATFNVSGPVYFDETLTLLYGETCLAAKEDVSFIGISVRGMEIGERRYGHPIWLEDAHEFESANDGGTTLRFNADGVLDAEIFYGGTYAQIRSDEQTAKNPDAKWDGYRAPAFLNGNVITMKPCGVKITRPNALYFFVPVWPDRRFMLTDANSLTLISASCYYGIPKGIKYEDAFARAKKRLKKGLFVVGAGKEVKIGKNTCFCGTMTRGKGVSAVTGQYYLIINGNMLLMIVAGSGGDLFKNTQKEIEECIASIEFIQPEYDPFEMLVTDKATGLCLTLPHIGWQTEGGVPFGARVTAIDVWTNAYVWVRTTPRQPDSDPDAYIAALGENFLDKGSVMVGKYAARWVDVESSTNGVEFITRRVYIFREKDIVVFEYWSLKETWDEAAADRDAIIKSLNFLVQT